MNLSSSNFYNKKIFIYGLARTGISTLNFLKNKGNKLICWDDKLKIRKKISKNFLLKSTKQLNKHLFDFIVISPGINKNNCSIKNFLRKNENKIITDLDIFYSHYTKNKIITITGTNGKSTTAKLLNLILINHKQDARLCGNIGNPVLLEKNISKKTIFVIEASSYQIDYSKIFKTNYAIILNISPDHLERHGSLKNYINAKFKLLKSQSRKDFAYINVKDKYLRKKIKRSKVFSKIINVNLNKIYKFGKKINNPYFLTRGNQENLSFIFYPILIFIILAIYPIIFF